MKILSQWVLVSGAIAVLAACGGGDSATPAADTTFPATAKYAGTWTSACDTDSDIKISGLNSNSTLSLVIPVSGSNTAIGGVIHRNIYANLDTGCLGAKQVVIDYNLSISIDGVGTGVGGSDKITGAYTAGTIAGNSFGGALVTLGNITYSAGVFNAQPGLKDLMLVSGNTLKFGDGTETATTYPTGIDSSIYNTFTKQ